MHLAEPAIGELTDISAFADPRMIVNMGEAQTAESFEDFVWKTVQERAAMRRGERFSFMDRQHLVLGSGGAGGRSSLAAGEGTA